jgi:hypothetical protein
MVNIFLSTHPCTVKREIPRSSLNEIYSPVIPNQTGNPEPFSHAKGYAC